MCLWHIFGLTLGSLQQVLLTLEALEGVRSVCGLFHVHPSMVPAVTCCHYFSKEALAEKGSKREHNMSIGCISLRLLLHSHLHCGAIRKCVVIGLSQTVPMWPCCLHYELTVISSHRLVPLGMFLNMSTCLVISKLVGIHTPHVCQIIWISQIFWWIICIILYYIILYFMICIIWLYYMSSQLCCQSPILIAASSVYLLAMRPWPPIWAWLTYDETKGGTFTALNTHVCWFSHVLTTCYLLFNDVYRKWSP